MFAAIAWYNGHLPTHLSIMSTALWQEPEEETDGCLRPCKMLQLYVLNGDVSSVCWWVNPQGVRNKCIWYIYIYIYHSKTVEGAVLNLRILILTYYVWHIRYFFISHIQHVPSTLYMISQWIRCLTSQSQTLLINIILVHFICKPLINITYMCWIACLCSGTLNDGKCIYSFIHKRNKLVPNHQYLYWRINMYCAVAFT